VRSLGLSLVLVSSACSSSSADAPIADAPTVGPAADAAVGPDAPPYPTVNLTATPVATGLSQPVAILVPPGETRFFVAEKTGTISIIENGTRRTPAFIDIHTNVSMNNFNEEGLLSLVFHPQYDTNQRVFVYFTGRATGSPESDRNVHIWEFHAAADGNSATFTKEIIDILHPGLNHNGGKMIFGPDDGMLYFSVGDGGGGFDTYGNSRILTTHLSKMNRIDVDHGDPYTSPPDNPFASMSDPAAKDVWFWGLRNPWRWSFDRKTHDIWIGDVGQACWEEIDHVPAGSKGNDFGWNVVEGINHLPTSNCGNPSTSVQSGATLPVTEYDHFGGADAVVGGYVYRGKAIPELGGMYFFADDGAGFVRSFWADFPVEFSATKDWTSLAKPAISTFDEDRDGELLYCSILPAPNGACYRIDRGN